MSEKAPSQELPTDSIVSQIFTKGTQEYTGSKYKSPLFFTNVNFDPPEIQAIEQILESAKNWWEYYASKNQEEWQKFEKILHDRRRKVGSIGEASNIITGPDVLETKKALSEKDVPQIKTTEHIHALYYWQLKIRDATDTINKYKSEEQRIHIKGRSAKSFGYNIRSLHKDFLLKIKKNRLA